MAVMHRTHVLLPGLVGALALAAVVVALAAAAHAWLLARDAAPSASPGD